MIRKTLAILVIATVLAAFVYALIPNDKDEAAGLSSAVLSDAVTTADAIPDTDGGVTVPLASGNTTIRFSCAKTVAGKTVVVRGGWSEQFNSVIGGTLTLDPDTRLPEVIDARVRIDSLWSEHEQLTHTLLTAGFFRPDDHPYATFKGAYQPDESATDAATTNGTISGAFVLNGISKQIAFPVNAEVNNEQLSITSEFSLDRRAFDVLFKESGALGLLTDEDIADDVAIRLDIQADLNTQPASDSPDSTNDTNQQTAPEQAIAAEDLPTVFTQTIPATQVGFDMVLVPGDPDKGVAPFYIGKHEVTWDEFMPWVQGGDLADEVQVGEERAMKLRPSSPYGSVDRNFGMYRRPALGMSRLSAELYCKWLSEQTGRHYRLPTEAEWEYAYAQGAPVTAPSSPSAAEAIATYEDNAWDDSIGDWATTKIGSREPNALGIHDMAGNVAEWVADTGEQHVVRGGHFESSISDLGVGRAAEDMDAWNRDYPNEPKSQWWYVNARWVGFRVACDPVAADVDNP